MKRIIYFIFATSLFVSCSGKQTLNSLTLEGLNGPVKSVSSNCYYALERFGDFEKGILIIEEDTWVPLYAGKKDEYNREGNLVKMTILDNYGTISYVNKTEYKYNFPISTYSYGGDGELSYSWKIIFENNKPVTIERYSNSEENANETIECDFDGFKLISEKYYQDGELIKKSENEFQNNLLRKTITTDKDGNVIYQLEQEYSKNGLVSYRHYIIQGEDVLEEHIDYDEKNMPILYSRTGKWSHGDVDYSFKYISFDNKGNWLTRVVCKANKPYILEERTIEYY